MVEYITISVTDSEENRLMLLKKSCSLFTTKEIGKGTGLGLSISKESSRITGDNYLWTGIMPIPVRHRNS